MAPSLYKNIIRARFWKSTYVSWMLSIALACLSLPPYQLIYGPNIDDSLHWAYNYFACGHFGLVQQVTFPHGPLAFILYPLALEKNFIIALGVQLILATALARLI